jgi:hypothetical protein
MKEKMPERKSMEGRDINAKGEEERDETFHRIGMNTTPEAEQRDAEEVEHVLPTLREAQAEKMAELSPKIGQAVYRSLIELYPNDPRRYAWEKRLEELE